MARAIAVIEVVGAGVVEIDRQFDQPQSQHAGVKVEIGLRISRDRRDVVNPKNLFVHKLLLCHGPAEFLQAGVELLFFVFVEYGQGLFQMLRMLGKCAFDQALARWC